MTNSFKTIHILFVITSIKISDDHPQEIQEMLCPHQLRAMEDDLLGKTILNDLK